MARIGMAVSDASKIIATPLKTQQASRKIEQSAKRIAEILADYDLDAVVVGLPLRLDGSNSQMTDEVQLFIQTLKEFVSCTVVPWDERLTSQQADRSLREAKLSRKKRAQNIDSVSALLILQSYLDSQQCQTGVC